MHRILLYENAELTLPTDGLMPREQACTCVRLTLMLSVNRDLVLFMTVLTVLRRVPGTQWSFAQWVHE